MVYVRYTYEDKFKKEFLFFAALLRRTTGLEISKTINNYSENNGLEIKNCEGVCSDSAAAMIAEKFGAIKQVKDLLQNVFQLIAFFTGKVL